MAAGRRWRCSEKRNGGWDSLSSPPRISSPRGSGPAIRERRRRCSPCTRRSRSRLRSCPTARPATMPSRAAGRSARSTAGCGCGRRGCSAIPQPRGVFWPARRRPPRVKSPRRGPRCCCSPATPAPHGLRFMKRGRRSWPRRWAWRAAAARGRAAGRSELYQLFARAPQSDDAAAGVPLAHGPLPPRVPAERVALARVVRGHGDPDEARRLVARALADGDSSGETLLLAGELYSVAGRYVDAAAAYQAAVRDSGTGALALYRRGRVLVRLGDPGAPQALVAFADRYPSDTASPTALYLVGDYLLDHHDSSGGERWLGELLRRYPSDSRASLGRFRLAAIALHTGAADSAVQLYGAEVGVGGVQRTAARYWMGRIAQQRGDSGIADSLWRLLA